MHTGRQRRYTARHLSRYITEAMEPRQLLAGTPAAAWSSYLGGSDSDYIQCVALDANGNAWVTGTTSSSDLAVGGFDTSYNGGYDAFVAKVNADGTLAWSSYLGGSDSDYGYGIALDASGNAWVTGYTGSSGWTVGGFDTSYAGGGDAFVAKINANGTLAWSSYLGGSGYDYANAVALDASGNAQVVGITYSSGWASGGFDTSYNGGGDAFVAKVNANGTLAWSSYLGGTGYDYGQNIALDATGNAWVTGYTNSSGWASGGFDTSFNGADDAFVTKINANGTLAWSSYLGGSDSDYGYGIALDAGGNAWVTGYTSSAGWAVGGFDTSHNGAQDGFVAKVNANGTLAWSSYLGGSGSDYGYDIALDTGGNAWVTGQTYSSDWIVGGFDTSYGGGGDGFVANISANGTLAWSSYLGGDGSDYGCSIALDAGGNAWVAGYTNSSGWTSGGFDTSFNGGNSDGLVARIRQNHAPTAVNLSNGTVAENRPAGTAVGTFSTVDPDSGDSFTYSLVSGTGSADNALFTIVGNELRTAAAFDYEARSSYAIRVRSTDSSGLTVEQALTISVTDLDEIAPTVSSLSINDGAAQRSMVKKLAVVFSEPMTLSSGALAVKLSTGAAVPNTTVDVTNPSGDQKTYVLSFSGSAVVGGSLADGIYDLIVTATGTQDLAGNVLTANYSQRFHRLFGDSDGNKVVNALDYARLKNALGRLPSDPLFNSAFDYEGNTLINALDLARFRQRYGMSFSY